MKTKITTFQSFSACSKIFFYLLSFVVLICSFPNLGNTQIIEGTLKLNQKRQKHTLIFVEEHPNIEGRILKVDKQKIVFKRIDKQVVIFEREKIAKIIVSNVKEINATIQNLAIFSPTAFNVKEGEKKYSNYLLFYNFYSQGITDNFSVTGGLSIIPPPLSSNFVIGFFGRTKWTHSFSESANIGFLATIGSLLEISNSNYRDNYFTASPSVVFTLGKSDKFLNFTATPYFILNEFGNSTYTERTDIFSIGGAINIKPRWSLILENVAVIESYDTDGMYYLSSLSNKIKSGRGSEFDVGITLFIDIRNRFYGGKEINFQPLPLLAYSLYF